MEDNRLFRFPKPAWLTSANTRTFGVYTAGAMFALGFYSLIDIAVWSKSTQNPSDPRVSVTFIDWIPGICSALGMLVINSIDKSRLSADSFSYSGNGVAWKARLVLFLGFALLAGGLAGSVVVLVMKYLVPGYAWPTIWMGVGNVVGNSLVMLSSATLWIAQNMEDEYAYNLAL